MTGLRVAYELSNFVYLFLWLAAEGSECARGHILLLLIAFRLNKEEFLAYCPLFMKWKEITSCVISLYIIRFILFLTFHSRVGPSCSRCRVGAVPIFCYRLVWSCRGGVGRGGTRRKAPPKVRQQQLWIQFGFCLSGALLSNQTQTPGAVFPHQSVSIETKSPSSSSSSAKSFWVVNVSSGSYF